MFDQVKINKPGLMDFLKNPERVKTEFSPKKTDSGFYKMLLEQTFTEGQIITTKPDNDENLIIPANQNNNESYRDERFSNNSMANIPDNSSREIDDRKVEPAKELAAKELPSKKKNESEIDSRESYIDQVSNESNLKNFIEVVKSALAGDSKTMNDKLRKLFNELKSGSGQKDFLNDMPVQTGNDKNQKYFNEILKLLGKEFKEAVFGEMLKFSGNRKSGKNIKKLSDKDIKEIALTILDNIKKNKSRGPVRHEVKSTSDEIKPDKKQTSVSEFSMKKIFISDDAARNKNSGGDKGSGRDGYNNAGGRIELLNKTISERNLAGTKAMDFRENLQDIIDKAKISVKDSSNGTFTVRLNPRELGSVNVNLIMENGVITGKFLVDNEDVKSLLLSNLSELKYQLEESGISVGEFSVNVNDQRGKFLKQNDDNGLVSVPFLNSDKDMITAVDQYSTNTVLHNGSINMVI